MGKFTTASVRRGGGRQLLCIKLRSGRLVPEPVRKVVKKPSEKMEVKELDTVFGLLRTSPPPSLAPMYYEGFERDHYRWVENENNRAKRVLAPLADLLDITVREMKIVVWELYGGDANQMACGDICLVYAGGLMMRWLRMVPLNSMRIWKVGRAALGPPSIYDEAALSAELLARRWSRMSDLPTLLIFIVSMVVATKQFNSTYSFRLEYCMPVLRRFGYSFPQAVVRTMEQRFLLQLQWRTHLRMRSHHASSASSAFPCEYDTILEALPSLLDDDHPILWSRLYEMMVAIGEK